jgi:hydroxylamine reductase (hybrid-cluster protein)
MQLVLSHLLVGYLYLHMNSKIYHYFFLVPYRDFFMSLAYITGGQYVPMVNSKLLAKVIIGGVREEISLDRLMQDAQADIDREMEKAEAEGVDEKEKAKRMNNVFSSKNLRSKQMKNSYGAMSSVATDCYSKCADMSEMKSKFSSTPAAAPVASASAMMKDEGAYDLAEDEAVSEEQASRMYQKWQHRKK